MLSKKGRKVHNNTYKLQPPVIGSLAADSAKDAKWDEKRADTLTVEGHYKQVEEFDRLASRMHQCSGTLGFQVFVNRETGELTYKLRQAKFCHVRYCPVCQWRRSLRNQARFLAKIPGLVAAHPKDRFLLLTLTIKNPPMSGLRATLADMGLAWKRLIKLKDFGAVKGWIRTTEVTLGDDGNPHPHYHILLHVPSSYFGSSYIKRDRWLEMWRDCMRDQSITQVDIRRVKAKGMKVDGVAVGGGADSDNSGVVVEVLKYATKAKDLTDNPEFLYGITQQTHKLRFIASGGTLKDMLKDEDATDAELIGGDEPAIDGLEDTGMVAHYNFDRAKRAYYRKKEGQPTN